ncbi:MAG: GTPase HflX [Chlorobi bacterium]|nr:GTPase HflX [Chlorobiota bacterium]
MIENKNLKPAIEKVALVGLALPGQSKQSVKDYLDELAFLVRTAGGEPVARFVQNRQKPHPKTFVGAGKLEEIRRAVEELKIDTVVFDDELSPSQQFQLEKELGVKILDRTRLILDIFALRAQTAYARTQVELAQYEYMLPRLKGMWTHLERQRGGIGMRGPGEREIETDRRIVKKRIADLRRKLAKIDTQKQVQRSNRGKMVRVALVGYTNVGKSTLMNLLAKSKVLAENKLFATLDTKTAKIQVENISFLVSDTVGFIRKLPTQLVESFKSTLDEVREADILLHVADASHPALEEQIATVRRILAEIGAGNKPEILVLNKIDLLDDEQRRLLENRFRSEDKPVLFISAEKKEGIDRLKRLLYREVRKIHISRFPHDDFLYPDLDFLD